MDRMIYLSMAGAKATLQRQDTLANNLANASTVGFRAELQAFRAVPVNGSGASTRVYALETTPGYDATPGVVQSTGRNLDVAMKGNAWLAVQALDGTEVYTRAGALEVDAEGVLTSAGGLTVLGDGGPITVPADASVSIGADGTLSAKSANGKTSTIGKLKLVTPEAPLERSTDGLFRAADGAELAADPAARVQDGALEGSNVNVVEELVSMIETQRAYETNAKAISTTDSMLGYLNNNL